MSYNGYKTTFFLNEFYNSNSFYKFMRMGNYIKRELNLDNESVKYNIGQARSQLLVPDVNYREVITIGRQYGIENAFDKLKWADQYGNAIEITNLNMARFQLEKRLDSVDWKDELSIEIRIYMASMARALGVDVNYLSIQPKSLNYPEMKDKMEEFVRINKLGPFTGFILLDSVGKVMEKNSEKVLPYIK